MSPWEELAKSWPAYFSVGGAGLAVLAALTVVAPHLWRRLLPLPRLRPGAWTGLDVFLAFLLYFGIATVLVLTAFRGLEEAGLYEPWFGTELSTEAKGNHTEILIGPVVTLAVLAAVLSALRTRTGTRPGQLGLTRARWPANVALGVLAFLVLTPPVLVLNAQILDWLGVREKHVLERLLEQGFQGWEWGFLVASAAVSAPLLEELLFRGVLQGWLRRASLSGHLMVIAATLFMAAQLGGERIEMYGPTLEGLAPLQFAAMLVLGYAIALAWMGTAFPFTERGLSAWNAAPGPPPPEPEEGDPEGPERLPDEAAGPAEADDAVRRRWEAANGWLSIYGSAMLFAVFHTRAWPSPVPLVLLALGLGWLAHRTGSLVGPITLHLLFNSVACLILYWTAVT